MIPVTSRKNSEARNEQNANNSTQCDPNQLPMVTEKDFDTNLMALVGEGNISVRKAIKIAG